MDFELPCNTCCNKLFGVDKSNLELDTYDQYQQRVSPKTKPTRALRSYAQNGIAEVYKDIAGEICSVRHVYYEDELAFEKAIPFNDAVKNRMHSICSHVHTSKTPICPYSIVINHCEECKRRLQSFKVPIEICMLQHLKNWEETMHLLAVHYVKQTRTWYLLLETDEDACDLGIYMEKKNDFSFPDKISIMTTMFNLCKDLYTQYQVLHGDTKWENYLVIKKGKKMVVKLIDFGLSVFTGTLPTIPQNCRQVFQFRHIDFYGPEIVDGLYSQDSIINRFETELFAISFITLSVLLGNEDVRACSVNLSRVKSSKLYFSSDMKNGLGKLTAAIENAHTKKTIENCNRTCSLCHLFFGGMGAEVKSGWFTFSPKDRNLLLLVVGI